jgi:hypothetical protein
MNKARNNNKNKLSQKQKDELLNILNERFENNMERHEGMDWKKIRLKIEKNEDKLWSLNEMEKTGGEPDIVEYDDKQNEYIFFDCSSESPKGRRSLCYDDEALKSRKLNKPKDSAMNMALRMGIELLSEEQYKFLQKKGVFDSKTSSWIKTPPEIRKLGGALFADFRYGTVFVYHNGAESYYGARGFRGFLRI